MRRGFRRTNTILLSTNAFSVTVRGSSTLLVQNTDHWNGGGFRISRDAERFAYLGRTPFVTERCVKNGPNGLPLTIDRRVKTVLDNLQVTEVVY